SAVEARLARRRPAAADQAELLYVPFAGRNGILAEQMQMAEVVVRSGVQLDELVVRSIDVGKEEDTLCVAAADIADIGDRCGKASAAIQLLLARLLQVLRTPAKVPDGRGDLGLRRLTRFVEEHPGFLCPDSVNLAFKTCLLAVEFSGVESNRCRRIGCIEMEVMKVGRGRWRRLRLGCPRGFLPPG